MFGNNVDVDKIFKGKPHTANDGCSIEISEDVVMRSNAGFYVGSACKHYDCCPGLIEPNDRYTP